MICSSVKGQCQCPWHAARAGAHDLSLRLVDGLYGSGWAGEAFLRLGRVGGLGRTQSGLEIPADAVWATPAVGRLIAAEMAGDAGNAFAVRVQVGHVRRDPVGVAPPRLVLVMPGGRVQKSSDSGDQGLAQSLC
ncbi:hypothetical protein JCM10369A_10260 [Nocardioides pyridinolyticus]